MSSRKPKCIAAVKPITDHINGIIRMETGHFLSPRSNKPNVKIVVPGHGAFGNKKLLDYTIKLFKIH